MFQPFLRFYSLLSDPKRMVAEALQVSTLLEILQSDLLEAVLAHAKFQPFLRFYLQELRYRSS